MPSVIEQEVRGTSDYSVTLTDSDKIPVLISGSQLKKVSPSLLGGGTTLYNGDSSLTGDRTVDLNGHFLKLNSGGSTYFSVDVAAGDIKLGNTTSGLVFKNQDNIFGTQVYIYDQSGNEFFLVDFTNKLFKLGDYTGGFNSTAFIIDDTASRFTFSLSGVPNYADNAAATGAGLTAGMLYRTSSGGTSTLKIVE